LICLALVLVMAEGTTLVLVSAVSINKDVSAESIFVFLSVGNVSDAAGTISPS
jgi:hypothetical protein